jgi:serine-type D-Ala-D-Ala carboxypeptidase/endopeptidase (penicillin-binding protein 4)
VDLQYAGELIAAFIERAGGSVKGKISTGAVPEGLEPVYVHRQSRTLSAILAGLLLGSNNYIANQVFLEIGGHRLGGPVSLEKSLQVANEVLAKHSLAESIHLEEGSGISRGNRFAARGLAQSCALAPSGSISLNGHTSQSHLPARYSSCSSFTTLRVVVRILPAGTVDVALLVEREVFP